MKISKRLRQVVQNVENAEVLADVGCDHGLASIYAVRTGRAERVVAMDIGKEPLSRAKKNVLFYHMEEQIVLRQSDGLGELGDKEADAVLISGMGGYLMSRILEEGESKLCKVKQLVLSPQSDISVVRKCLHRLGFRIEKEEMLCEQKKFYVIIRAVPGKEVYQTESEYYYGKCLIDGRDPVFIAYLGKKQKQLAALISQMQSKDLSEQGQSVLDEHQKRCRQITEILYKIEGNQI